MDKTPWWQDKNFILTLVNAAILVIGMVRGVPATPGTKASIEAAESHAAAAAETTRATGEKVDKVQRQAAATAVKVGAPVEKE